jgi:hypothetical protein
VPNTIVLGADDPNVFVVKVMRLKIGFRHRATLGTGKTQLGAIEMAGVTAAHVLGGVQIQSQVETAEEGSDVAAQARVQLLGGPGWADHERQAAEHVVAVPKRRRQPRLGPVLVRAFHRDGPSVGILRVDHSLVILLIEQRALEYEIFGFDPAVPRYFEKQTEREQDDVANLMRLEESARALRREARRTARTLSADPFPRAKPLARLIDAAVDWAEHRDDAMCTQLHAAVAEFESQSMRMFAAAARMRLGAALGGDGGREIISAATDVISREELARPACVIDMLAPGFER